MAAETGSTYSTTLSSVASDSVDLSSTTAHSSAVGVGVIGVPQGAPSTTSHTHPPSLPPPTQTPLQDFNPDASKTKAHKRLMIIIAGRVLTLLLCVLVIALGIGGVHSSAAFKATESEQERCKGLSSSYVDGSYRSNRHWTNDPAWLTDFKWAHALSVITLIFALLSLGVFGCLVSGGKFHKGWPCDVATQLLLCLLVGIAGALLFVGLEDVLKAGRKEYVDCRAENSYRSWKEPEKPKKEVRFASEEEIKPLVNYYTVMAAAVLAILAALAFLLLVALIVLFRPTEAESAELGGQDGYPQGGGGYPQGGGGYPVGGGGYPQGGVMMQQQQPQMVVMPVTYGGAMYSPSTMYYGTGGPSYY